MTTDARDALKAAFNLAQELHHYQIDAEHILIALLSKEDYPSYKVIQKVGVDPKQVREQLISIFNDLSEMNEMLRRQSTTPRPNEPNQPAPDQPEFFPNEPYTPPSPWAPATRTKTREGKLLEFFATDLTAQAKAGKLDPVIGREEEVNRAIHILLRKGKNNPVFIGEPGVGKTAVVEGLAARIADGKVPEKLYRKKIYQLDLGMIVAGTVYRGQFEDRLKKILTEATERKDIILFIDELHTIVGTGSAEGSLDAANLIKPILTRGEIHLIGATTTDEYRKHIEKDSALERRLQPIIVEEPSVEQTIKILEGLRSVYEAHHGVEIEDEAISAAAYLSQKYLSDRFLPDKAIDLLDEAAAAKIISTQKEGGVSRRSEISRQLDDLQAKKENLIAEEKFEQAAKVRDEELKLREVEKSTLQSHKTKPAPHVTSRDIASLISAATNIPLGELVKDELEKFLHIESELGKYIAGQKEVIRELARALRRNRSGVATSERPIGSFIFLGPSGVGKTEVARILARHVYGKESALVKIDMSEFMERHNVARLVGAPPGYVGFEEAGMLTETVRRNPYSVILFDEIEKAHPDVFNLLLQILDEGRLADAKGRSVNFRNTIIIMTSNIGLEEYRKIAKIGFRLEGEQPFEAASLKGIISEKLFEAFRPELINRLDKIIVFDTLTKANLREIAEIQLGYLKERLKKKGIELTFSSRVLDKLAGGSYDCSFGARPLIRTIQDKIENLISDQILQLKAKRAKVTIDVKANRFVARAG